MLARGLQSVRRVLLQQAKRRSHDHHAPVNPGPPCTYDMAPIPSQPYLKVYNELQGKFNTYLAVSLTLLASAFGAAIYTNLWAIEEMRPPRSWRERK